MKGSYFCRTSSCAFCFSSFVYFLPLHSSALAQNCELLRNRQPPDSLLTSKGWQLTLQKPAQLPAWQAWCGRSECTAPCHPPIAGGEERAAARRLAVAQLPPWWSEPRCTNRRCTKQYSAPHLRNSIAAAPVLLPQNCNVVVKVTSLVKRSLRSLCPVVQGLYMSKGACNLCLLYGVMQRRA